MPRTEHTIANQKAVKKALALFAARVFAHRYRHKLSRRALAEQVGCSESNIKNIETGGSAPSFAVLVVLGEIIEESAGNSVSTGIEQVLHNGRWVNALTMPNFDANKKYKWRKK